MRFDELVLLSFGPFINRRVRLARGMTLIAGKNEAGKSTIHAGLYAGLCGVRRGKGGARKEDTEFAARHKPWNAKRTWEVSAVVTLDDGRRVELTQNLDGSGPSFARQVPGGDVAKTILNEGNPDGSLWFGLDRRSFRATACVRQAEVLEVLDDPALLQTHLQRAAAGANKDETAARALTRVADYEREHVGQDKTHSTKPLRRMRERRDAAVVLRQQVAERQRELDRLRIGAGEATARAKHLESLINAAEASKAQALANEAARVFHRAQELAARFPGGPPVLIAQDGLMQDVVRATQLWASRPSPALLSGPASPELREQLDTLPLAPVGDQRPDPSVVSAGAAYERANVTAEVHGAIRPHVAVSKQGPEAAEEEIRELAATLARHPNLPSLELNREIVGTKGAGSRVEVKSSRKRRNAMLIAAATALGVAIALAFNAVWLGLAALALGSIAFVWSRTRSTTVRHTETAQQSQIVLPPSEIERAVKRVRQLGIPDDPAELMKLAAAIASQSRDQEEFARWEARSIELQAALDAAKTLLESRLRERGGFVSGNAGADLVAYGEACRHREAVAAEAGRREVLEERLAFRVRVEQAAADTADAIGQVEQTLRRVAAACGISGQEDVALHAALLQWLDERARVAARAEATQRDWTELQTLLGGRTLEELGVEHAQKAGDVGELLAKVLTTAASVGSNTPLSDLRTAYAKAAESAATLRAEAQTLERAMPPLETAEKELEYAEADLRAVEELARTLTLTREFLERAQDRVHLTLAPLLQGTLDRWLPRVTNGRYVQSMIDPLTLTVRIRTSDGHWRDAQWLSHGTAEQTYLLLRMAMADELTKGSESCPLLLDDVIAHSDQDRANALLELLHEISANRQVILFTMSDDAAAWAEQNLHEPQDRSERLKEVDIPA